MVVSSPSMVLYQHWEQLQGVAVGKQTARLRECHPDEDDLDDSPEEYYLECRGVKCHLVSRRRKSRYLSQWGCFLLPYIMRELISHIDADAYGASWPIT